MHRKQLIIACYTAGVYAKEAEEKLLKSVRELGLPHDVREISCQGTWVANGFACQEFILSMEREMPGVDFLFLDVDAMVRSNPWPYLEKLDCDLAGHYFKDTELLTGTLYLPATTRRIQLLTEWIQQNHEHPNIWDQKNLQRLLGERDFRMHRLPPEYCFIFDLQKKLTPKVVPVIEHFQASRRLKKGVGHE